MTQLIAAPGATAGRVSSTRRCRTAWRVLARGAHATYGGRERTAAEIAATVEAELGQAGAQVLDADDITF